MIFPIWVFYWLSAIYFLSVLFCLYVIIKKEDKNVKVVVLTLCSIFVPLFAILYLIITAGEILFKKAKKA